MQPSADIILLSKITHISDAPEHHYNHRLCSAAHSIVDTHAQHQHKSVRTLYILLKFPLRLYSGKLYHKMRLHQNGKLIFLHKNGGKLYITLHTSSGKKLNIMV
jgi:hypothetical protein